MPFLSQNCLVSYTEMDLYKTSVNTRFLPLYMFKVPFTLLLAVPVCLNMVHTLWCLVNVTKNSLRQDFQMESLPLLGAARIHVLRQASHASACGTEGLIKWTGLKSSVQLRSDKGAETEEFPIYSSSKASRGTATSADVFSRLAQDILFVIETHKIFYLAYAKGVNRSILTF